MKAPTGSSADRPEVRRSAKSGGPVGKAPVESRGRQLERGLRSKENQERKVHRDHKRLQNNRRTQPLTMHEK